MELLVETFPFAFGVLLGVTCHRLGGVAGRWVLVAFGSMALGSFATFASGEWRGSLLYFAFDIALVAGVCVGSAWLLSLRKPRAVE